MRILPLIAVVLLVSSFAASARADMADACKQTHDWDLKIDGCTAVIRSGEGQEIDHTWAYNNRGLAYVNLGEYRRAIKDYDEALRRDPFYANAYQGRGLAYVNLGEYRRAIEDYDQALRLDPNNAGAYYRRGYAYGKLDKHRRAIWDLDQSLRLRPGHAYAYFSRGQAYDNLGDYRRAIEDYDLALRRDPRITYAYMKRGGAYQSLGDYERAVSDWEQSLRIGGAPTVKAWQEYLKGLGHYAGATDGINSPATQRGLKACARDPNC
jgi:tetratricopeptide (TPR) repeat protein